MLDVGTKKYDDSDLKEAVPQTAHVTGSRLLDRRIREIDRHSDNQCCSVASCDTTDDIQAPQMVKCYEKHSPVPIAFLDLRLITTQRS